MYGHRELFHSNLIAWFFDELPAAADAVFRPLAGQGTGSRRRVERERGHMDLVMHWPDTAPLVIENKVFSLPRPEQLRQYQAATATWPTHPSFVLLSVSAGATDVDGWQYLSYHELASRIRAALPACGSYEVATMRRYADLADDLAALVSAVDIRGDQEPVWPADTVLDSIVGSPTRSILQKGRAERIAGLLNHLLPELEQQAHSAMTNSVPLVEALESVRVDGIDVHLGWQLQGDQFRRCVAFHDPDVHGRSAESRERREDLSRRHPEFFVFPPGLPQVHAGRSEFNHYAPNFVYQYVRTPGLTIGALIQAATFVHAQLEPWQRDGG